MCMLEADLLHVLGYLREDINGKNKPIYSKSIIKSSLNELKIIVFSTDFDCKLLTHTRDASRDL